MNELPEELKSLIIEFDGRNTCDKCSKRFTNRSSYYKKVYAYGNYYCWWFICEGGSAYWKAGEVHYSTNKRVKSITALIYEWEGCLYNREEWDYITFVCRKCAKGWCSDGKWKDIKLN